MGTALLSHNLQLEADLNLGQTSSDLLLRLEAYDVRLKKLEARAALLSWASSVVGLPITHISQVGNSIL